jgi:FkbM family methyltransferase
MGTRSWARIINAPFQPIHYNALLGIFREYPNPIENLKRYLFDAGEYPYPIKIRTPIGEVRPTLWTPHDIRTVNEIFCRRDYPADENIKVVVDIGSNIGISALYFLSRNPYVKCYLYEPNPENVHKLIDNLSGFEQRYRLHEIAVGTQSGQLQFATEPTGRYGGLVIDNIYRGNCSQKITVDCDDINSTLKSIFEKEQSIDILKIDTEGTEVSLVKSICTEFLYKIKRIYFEMNAQDFKAIQKQLFPNLKSELKLSHRQYGDTYQLTIHPN